MENKKLLKYLLKDLIELEEMFAEEGRTSFDALELEFIRNRILGAKGLVKLYLGTDESDTKSDTEHSVISDTKPEELEIAESNSKQISEVDNQTVEKVEELVKEEPKEEVQIQEEPANEKVAETPPVVEIKEEPVNNKESEEVKVEPVKEEVHVEQKQAIEEDLKQEKGKNKEEKDDVQYDEEEIVDEQNRRLGDSFLKGKSVNDLMSGDFSKLEHKLSNRPVLSIKTSIGINDKFQYIRELFEGSAEKFTKAVDELDALDNIKDAVHYLQTNYKWKKNETSLKFVNLIKRRFSDE